MSECICGADEPCEGRCERHGRDLHGWPCGACGAEWEQAHPKTAHAIGLVAAGRGTTNLAAARRADAAAHTAPCRWQCASKETSA